METAFELARKGIGHVEPNPPVGAVITQNGEVVGTGYHREFGGPHAEVHALEEAGEQAKGGTLYCTLEPCNVARKTPPCTEAIIEAGIEEVFVSVLDPSLSIPGEGIQELLDEHMGIHIGLKEQTGADLIRKFIVFHREKRSYLEAKWAMSLDGKIATRTGDSKWITSEDARQKGRQLRVRAGAVMVGIGTALQDNPTLLGPEKTSARQPIRIVVDSTGRLSQDMNLCTTTEYAQTILATTDRISTAKLKELEGQRVRTEVLEANEQGQVPLPDLLERLREQHIQAVYLEGGGTLLGAAFDQELVDEAHAFLSPVVIGGKNALSPVEGKGVELVSKGFQGRVREQVSLDDDYLLNVQIREVNSPPVPDELTEYHMS